MYTIHGLWGKVSQVKQQSSSWSSITKHYSNNIRYIYSVQHNVQNRISPESVMNRLQGKYIPNPMQYNDGTPIVRFSKLGGNAGICKFGG